MLHTYVSRLCTPSSKAFTGRVMTRGRLNSRQGVDATPLKQASAPKHPTAQNASEIYRSPWPNCSVPKVPMPFRRKLKTNLFSLRTPTLKV